jgi:hypothetical protein
LFARDANIGSGFSFVGRDKEVESLRTQLVQACEVRHGLTSEQIYSSLVGKSSLIYLKGPAGMMFCWYVVQTNLLISGSGKSHLVDEVIGSLSKYLPSKVQAPIVVSIDCKSDFGNEDQRRIRGDICKKLLIEVEGDCTGFSVKGVTKQLPRIKKLVTRLSDDQPMMYVLSLYLLSFRSFVNIFV